MLGGWSLLAGWNAAKEYAELEWPFDIAITVAWVAYGVVFFGTIARRKVGPIYISNWFYGALIIVIAMLHIVNNLELPATLGKSYSLFAGAQDAIVQWWYGHNAVGFLLTGGFLGMLYYFLPKQAEQPIWSYRLSIVAFWAFVYSYIWAGPHHLHYNAIPEWVQSLGVVMSLVLLAPSWATMINGVMTVANAWRKIAHRSRAEVHRARARVLRARDVRRADARDPQRERNEPLHGVDDRPRAFGRARLERADHVRHVLLPGAEARGPRRCTASRWRTLHFWLALAGIMLYIISMWGAGLSQSLLWL